MQTLRLASEAKARRRPQASLPVLTQRGAEHAGSSPSARLPTALGRGTLVPPVSGHRPSSSPRPVRESDTPPGPLGGTKLGAPGRAGLRVLCR